MASLVIIHMPSVYLPDKMSIRQINQIGGSGEYFKLRPKIDPNYMKSSSLKVSELFCFYSTRKVQGFKNQKTAFFGLISHVVYIPKRLSLSISVILISISIYHNGVAWKIHNTMHNGISATC